MFTQKDLTGLQEAAAAFIRRYDDGLTERRIQYLIFYTDYRYYQEHDEQFTSADYTLSGGVFSKDIREALERMDCDTRRYATRNERGVKYLDVPGDIDIWELDDEWVAEIFLETKDASTQELAEWISTTPFYDALEWRETTEFTAETVESL